MSNIKMMVWNLQEFGAASSTKGNYVPLCNFIANVVSHQDAQILVIQEVKMGAVSYLGQLTNALNNYTGGQWEYDMVLGATTVDPSNQMPSKFSDTKLSTDHSEGYALLWDGGNPDFTIQNAVNPISVRAFYNSNAYKLDLVCSGRNQGSLVQQKNHSLNGWFNAPAFTPNSPNAGFSLSFIRSNPNTHGNLAPTDARRPCTFTINLDPYNKHNNPGRYLVPVVVYHATSNSRSRAHNTQLAGYSRQLYQVHDGSKWVNAENAIIGGDFNVDASKNDVDRSAYSVYTSSYNNSGANMESGYGAFGNDSPKTTVKIAHINGKLTTGTTGDDFLSLSIDHIFYRLPNGQPSDNVDVEIVDLLHMVQKSYEFEGLQDNITGFWAPVKAKLGTRQNNGSYTNYPNLNVNSGIPEDDDNVAVIAHIANWTNFMYGIIGSSFDTINGTDKQDDARGAAEFLNRLVSDHLPVAISFDF